jgi:hypothetical protein
MELLLTQHLPRSPSRPRHATSLLDHTSSGLSGVWREVYNLRRNLANAEGMSNEHVRVEPELE